MGPSSAVHASALELLFQAGDSAGVARCSSDIILNLHPSISTSLVRLPSSRPPSPLHQTLRLIRAFGRKRSLFNTTEGLTLVHCSVQYERRRIYTTNHQIVRLALVGASSYHVWSRGRHLAISQTRWTTAHRLINGVLQDREAVFPTRQSLGLMKSKLKGAETGHSLLKRKSEALTK